MSLNDAVYQRRPYDSHPPPIAPPSPFNRRLDKATLDYEVMDGIVKREESIKGFVTKESRGVEEKRARIRDLKQQLLLVTLE